jgi:hypothetical protein
MSDNCLNIFLQKHQIPFDGTHVSGFGTITREQLAKSFSTTLLDGFYERSFEEQKLLLITLKELRDSFSSDFTQKLHSKYLMNASFFDRDKYMEELYKVTQIGLNPPIGNGGYLQLIHLMLRNLEQRQYIESGWFRSMMFDFYDCMFKIIIHSPAPDAVVDKKTEISTQDKNNDDDLSEAATRRRKSTHVHRPTPNAAPAFKKLSKLWLSPTSTRGPDVAPTSSAPPSAPLKNIDVRPPAAFESSIVNMVNRYDKKTEISTPDKNEILLTPDNFEFKGYNMDGYKLNTKKNKDSKKGGNKKTKNKQKTNKKNKKTKRKY